MREKKCNPNLTLFSGSKNSIHSKQKRKRDAHKTCRAKHMHLRKVNVLVLGKTLEFLVQLVLKLRNSYKDFTEFCRTNEFVFSH